MRRDELSRRGSSGFLNLDKPAGLTSHDCVARMRRALRTRQIGHAGTLDPMATGVLILCVGHATRLSERVMGGTKEYRAGIRFGVTTTTQDADGAVLESRSAAHLDRATLEQLLSRFTGEVHQVPPMVSSVHHEGRRLHELARQGITVNRVPRRVTIESLRLRQFDPGDRAFAEIDVRCSSGTYVRTLAEDLGNEAGCGAHLCALRRNAVGPWRVGSAVPLDEAEARARDESLLLEPMTVALSDLVTLDSASCREIAHGRSIPVAGTALSPTSADDAVGMVDESGNLVALARRCEGRLHPYKVFLMPDPGEPA